MKIALYYPWVYLKSGAERSILELAKRSRHDITIFTNHYDAGQTYPEFAGLKIVELQRVPVDRTFTKVMQSGFRIASQKLDLAGYDALLVVCEGLGDMIVLRNHDKPVFCLCLTPLRPVYDEVYRHNYLEGKGLLTRLKLSVFAAAYRLIDRIAWKRYRKILCISHEVSRRVLNGRLAAEGKLGYAFPGIDYSRLTPTGSMEKYFLLPGRIMWTKNIELGIEAFLEFRRSSPCASEFKLIVAGLVDKKSVPYFESLQVLAGNSSGVEFVQHPDDRLLFDLYDRAYAILFTPFNEDWGIVPLEAMAHAKPVIAVKRGGAMETVRHGENGLLAEPHPVDFARCMATLAECREESRRMGENGRINVQRYDWRHFVGDVDDMLEEAI